MKLTGDGFVLLILGQTVVFLFLGLMVLFINVSAWFVKRFLPTEEHEVFEELHEEAPAVAAVVEDHGAIAVAAVAVHQLRAHS